MKEFGMDFNKNPEFNTVTGLTNTTFDPNNVVSNRGATEGQIKTLHDDIGELETRIEGCCTHQDDTQLIQQMLDRIDELEAQINDCCNRTCYDIEQGGEGPYNPQSCPGNTVTVSFGWDGPNIYSAGGTASAVSSSGAAIAGYYLVTVINGVPTKVSVAGQWSISGSGHVQWNSVWAPGHPVAIAAVDADGCEGYTNVSFPLFAAVV